LLQLPDRARFALIACQNRHEFAPQCPQALGIRRVRDARFQPAGPVPGAGPGVKGRKHGRAYFFYSGRFVRVRGAQWFQVLRAACKRGSEPGHGVHLGVIETRVVMGEQVVKSGKLFHLVIKDSYFL
jgi:hypothetical protein